MAKKQISNYKFFPGVIPPPYNQYPNAVSLITANKQYVVKEVMGYLQAATSTPSYSLTAGAAGTYAISLLQANKTFIQDETSAWISQQITKDTKCKRDLGYLINGSAYDLVLGTNYNQVFLGHAESNSLDTSSITTNIGLTNDDLTALSAASAYTTEIDSFFSTVLDMAVAGNPAPALSFSNPSNAANTIIAVKDKLVANRAFIAAEVNAWVANTYPGSTHDAAKCARDIGYAVDAICYDMLYGGNSATYDQAKFFFYSFADGSPGIDPTHKAQTVAAYGHLKNIISPIVQGITISKTTTGSNPNLLSQTTSGDNGLSTEGIFVQDLVQITIDVVGASTQSAANAVLDAITRTTPEFVWATTPVQNAANAMLAAKASIALNRAGPFVDYNYDSTKQIKCKRDIGYLIDAFVTDLAGGGNFETIRIARMFYLNGTAQLLSPALEAATHTFVKSLLNTYILPKVAYTSIQTSSTQSVTGGTGEAYAIAKVDTLNDIVVNLIESGVGSLPTTTYNYNEVFANYVYGATKCKRDIAYILEAVAFDVALTTNYNAIFIGHAEKNSLDLSQTVIDTINASKAQVLALSAVSASAGAISQVNSDYTEILSIAQGGTASAVSFTNPSGQTASLIAVKDRLIANKTFIAAEINAWVHVTYPSHNHDEAKCARDVGYAIDALCYDMLYGGNSATYDSSKFFFYSGAATITEEHKIQTVQAYNRLKTVVGQIVQNSTVTKSITDTGDSRYPGNQNTSGTAANSTDASSTQALVQVIIDVVNGGTGALPGTRTTPSVTWATTALKDAKTAIETNSTAIQDAVVTYSDYTYDADKCERDSTYIVDSYIYDMMYGGNSMSYYVANQYHLNGVVQVNRPQVEVLSQTFARDLINQYVLLNKYHPSYQYTEYQTVDNSLTSEQAAAGVLTTLSNIIINTIGNGLSSLPAPVAPDTQSGGILPNAVSLLEANKRFVQEEAIAYIQYNIDNNISPYVFYTYNADKCRRDVSYVLEGYISDLKHGGNRQTCFNASKYWENGVAQVDGDRQPEIYAHTFIRDLIENYIWTNVTFTPRQILVSQSINNGIQVEACANTKLGELSNTILRVIENGVAYLPTKVSNRGYVKLPGFFKLKDILLITNTSRNQIMFNFADPYSAAEATYSEDYDSDFPGALYGVDKITTITFDVDTSGMMVTDNIQIFVESKEQAVRLNSSGTDAMERMKVGIPQSMLDADFEYGLQPTKWQALALMRNYPSIYEIPGSDIAVTNVVTDASSGTGNAGASLITVTTQNSHGLVVGDPITIKALANTISGFSRAEGSFLISSVPGLNSFTYYAKSKVGTSNGQVLASTYTQLRRGGFYTGSAIGNPTFSVYSAGSSGSVTTALITELGRDVIGFTGSPPPVGSPLSGTGIASGAQVTAVTGSGGVVASTKIVNRVLVGNTSFVVESTTGISPGLIFDRGDGVSVTVTDVTGNTVSLGSALTSEIIGTTENYPGVAQSATSGDGTGAEFTVSRSSDVYSSIITGTGNGYVANDTITIPGTLLGGASPDNDATVTVVAASPANTVLSLDNTTLFGGSGYATANNVGTSASLTGVGLTVDVTESSGVLTDVVIRAAGSGYAPGEVITITHTVGAVLAAALNTTPIGTGYSSATGMTTTATTGTGTGLTVDIIDDGLGGVASFTINNPGSGYAIGDTVTIDSATNDAIITISAVSVSATINVLSVTPGGVIQDVSIDGTPITAPTNDFYSAFTISEATTAQIASGNTGISYSAIATIQVAFASAHGFIPGDTITVAVSSTGTGAQLAAGPFFVEQVPTSNVIRYTARAAGTIDNTLVGVIYGRPDSFFVHRPFDGGVQLGTASPSHGASAIRMSKKYIRYQSGKGVMYNTGALFAPSYDIRSMTSTGTTAGSVITLTTDDTDHGCQVGGIISINGVLTAGYNGTYTVSDITNERQLSIIADKTLAATTAVLGSPCQMSIRNWHGATIRAGIFDDQNGMFWQYDGQRMAVVRRSSTSQLAGTIAINANSNLVTGNNTRFTSQLAAGDRVVIRGMSHVVSLVSDDTTMYVTPDFRGVNNVAEAKIVKTIDIQIPQENWNLDQLNGSGASGYVIDVTKMQMIGLQHTWYGAGFIDFMLRGPEGNYVWAHRFRNSNVNAEAYMRTGNQPVRYEVINEGAKDKLSAAMDATQTTIPLTNSYWFPTSGTVIIDNELIRFTGNTGTALTGCVRGTTLNQFVAGSQRSFSGGAAASHAAAAGVILVSNTITPNISHWGSAFMIDGQFDSDRGYIFNYAATGISATLEKTTAFLIRLAPSVSNAQTGDLGEKELLNRAQLLLSSISITSDTVSGGGGIVIEGVLNPQNYPTDPTKITWNGLAGSAQGGQPSFAQIAAGGSVTWSGNASTSTATIQGAFTTTLTAKSFNTVTNPLTATSFGTVNQTVSARSFASATSGTYNNALSNARTDFLILQSDLDSLNTVNTVQAGDVLNVLGNGTTLSSVAITSSNGTFSCNSTASTLNVGERITISGNNFSTCSINGYINPTSYYIIATNGNTTFTLSTSPNGSAVSTNPGNPSGWTFTRNSILVSRTINSVTQNYITLNSQVYARIVMNQAANYSSGTAATNGQYDVSVQFTSSLATRYNTAISNARNDFLVPNAQASAVAIADVLSATTVLTGGQTISAITTAYCTINSVLYARITMTANGSSTSTSGSGNNVNVTATFSSSNTYNRAFTTTRSDFLITDTQYATSGVAVSDTLSAATYITGGQTISTIIPSFINIGGTSYTRIVMSANGNANSTANAGNDITVTVTAAGSAASYANKNFLFFTSASWLASGATAGTKVATSYTQFPAGTSVVGTSTRTFGATTVYRVTFTQTANTTISAATDITFQFGSLYALPGEQVFSFIANPGESQELSLEALKELTATAIGGRGTFPNGPDVLAINVYKVSGTATPANLILRWGEAQA